MSSKNLEYSEISTRVLLIADYFKKNMGTSNSDLLKKAGIGHSFFSNIRNKKIDNPNSEMIRKLVIATGVNGHWILTGEGEMFESRLSLASDSEVPYTVLMDRAEQLLSSIEEKITGSGIDLLSPDIDIQLSQLLTTILQRRHEARKH